MLQTIEELSLLSVAGIVAAIVLAAVTIYALVQWPPARRNTRRAVDRGAVRADVFSAGSGAPKTDPRTDRSTDPRTDTLPDLRTIAKVRAGREGNRPSEDDIARAHMGPRGRPGEAAPALALDESITQNPKNLDPGHTA